MFKSWLTFGLMDTILFTNRGSRRTNYSCTFKYMFLEGDKWLKPCAVYLKVSNCLIFSLSLSPLAFFLASVTYRLLQTWTFVLGFHWPIKVGQLLSSLSTGSSKTHCFHNSTLKNPCFKKLLLSCCPDWIMSPFFNCKNCLKFWFVYHGLGCLSFLAYTRCTWFFN